MKMKLFTDLREDKPVARENAIAALAALEPVYLFLADYADDADSAACWDALYECPEYDAVKRALMFYLPHPLLHAKGTMDFILANDSSLDAEDLFQMCYERVVSRLMTVYRNVNGRYNTKKGMVDKAEGWILYINKMVGTYLCDLARRYDSDFGRKSARKSNVLNLYEKAGQEILSADDLQIGESVVRNSNQVGTFSGVSFREGGKYAQMEFSDGCTVYIRWEQVHKTVRRFTGNIQDVPLLETVEEVRKPKPRNISLDASLNEDEEGFTQLNLLPGGESCEEKLLRNDMNDVIRKSYLAAISMVQSEFSSVVMLCYLVHDELSLQLTHYPEILAKLNATNPLELAQSIHIQNCLMLNIDPSQHTLDIRTDSLEPSYTVRQLTVAKNQAKRLFRETLTQALAA